MGDFGGQNIMRIIVNEIMITIKIYVEGGVVIDVKNLPPNCDYEIIDYDNTGAEERDNDN